MRTRQRTKSVEKKERLSLSRQKARLWAQRQSIDKDCAKISKTPLKALHKKMNLLGEDKTKMSSSKKEILAGARAKSRLWAESCHSPTPVKPRDMKEEFAGKLKSASKKERLSIAREKSRLWAKSHTARVTEEEETDERDCRLFVTSDNKEERDEEAERVASKQESQKRRRKRKQRY